MPFHFNIYLNHKSITIMTLFTKNSLLRGVAVGLMTVTAMLSYGGTLYSKVTATSTGNGKVYVSEYGKNDLKDDSQITSETHSLTIATDPMSATSTSPSANHGYLLFAKGDAGYGFQKWSDNNTENPRYYPFNSVTSKKEASPDTKTITATFAPSALTVRSNDYTIGWVKIYDSAKPTVNKSVNAVGDVVDIEAYTRAAMEEWGHQMEPGKQVIFEGWYDKDGNLVTTDRIIKNHVVADNDEFLARFRLEFGIKTDDNNKIYGYYRLQSPLLKDETHFLTIIGSHRYKASDFSATSNSETRFLTATIDLNQYSYYQQYGSDNNGGKKPDAYAMSEAPYADAGSIFYVTAEPTANLRSTVRSTKVADKIMASSQGTSISDILPANTNFDLRAGTLPGFYHIGSKISGKDLTLQFAGAHRRAWVTSDKPGDAMQLVNGDLEIQPVDIEHIDKYYFGAMPDETMKAEGGYWTSMYTAFPYECYEPDGVEAYVAESEELQNGVSTIIIRRLESGIVPAMTPVLLKCRGTSPKENRLIPVLPDDTRLADASANITSNLLLGDFALWKDKDYSGRTPFDESTMRVFSVNADGVVGFYKLRANEDGTQQELQPNRAYLSLPLLPQSTATASYAISVRSIDADLSGIKVPGSDDIFNDAPAEYFTIDGRAPSFDNQRN